jgi:hypothetical protein
MTAGKAGKLALLWRGNGQARGEGTARTRKPHNQAHALCTLCLRRHFKR